MVNPGAFQGGRKAFLLAEKPTYAMAVDGGYAADGVADILRRFLKRFPLDLPDDEEPSEDHLAAVDDGAADPEVEEPDPTKVSPEDFEMALEQAKVRQERFMFRKAQIKRWMAYQYRKDHDLDATESGMYNQYRVLMAKLTNKTLDRPRLKTAVNVWRKTQRGAIEEECRRTVEAAKKKPLKPGEKPECLIAMRSRVATKMFGKLSKEDRAFWEMEASAEHELALAQWKADAKAPVPTDPAARQRCIQGLVHFVQPILDLVSEATGWKVSMIAGGPEPAHGGQLNVISIHSGFTTGDVKMNFGRAERVRFRNTVVPLYGSFLRKCYSPEECRARALPKEEGYIPMVDQDLENEAASCDTIVWDSSSASSSRAVTPALLVEKLSAELRGKSDTPTVTSAPAQRKPRTAHKNGLAARTLGNPLTPGVNPSPPPVSTAPDVNPNPPAVSAAPDVNPNPPAVSAAPDVNPNPPPVSAAPNVNPNPGSNASEVPSAPVEPLMAHEETHSDNPFPFQVEGTPAPTSPPPSLPPSPAHSPAVSCSQLPVVPEETVGASGAESIEAEKRSGSRAVAEGAGPMEVDRPEEVGSRAVAEGAEPMDVDKPEEGRSRAVEEEENRTVGVGITVVRRSGRAGKTSASLLEAETDGSRKGRKRAVEEATSTTGGASSSARAKKPRTLRASSTSPPIQHTSTPANAPAWFSKAMSMLASADLGPEWKTLLSHWAAFEASANYTSSTNLSAAQRPTAVKDWIQRARSTTWRPAIADTKQYGLQFMDWWMTLQPDWRKPGKETMVPPSSQEGGWEKVGRGGVNGLLSVIVALFFWGFAVSEKGTDDGAWLTAVKDVDGAVSCLISD